MARKVEKKEVKEGIFLGKYLHSIDGQRRLAIPSGWRSKKAGDRFIVVPGRNSRLHLIPFEDFLWFIEKARKSSFAEADTEEALELLGSQSEECVCDSQGRIALTQELMDHAGLKDSAMLVGAVARAHICAPDRWEKEKKSNDEMLDGVKKITERQDDLMSMIKGRLEGK